MHNFLDFDKPIAELESKLEELRHLSDSGDVDIADDFSKLQSKADRLLKQTYARLSHWQKTMTGAGQTQTLPLRRASPTSCRMPGGALPCIVQLGQS